MTCNIDDGISLYVGTTNEVTGIYASTDGSPYNAATVEILSVVDVLGATVSGATFPIHMVYEAASDGKYVGVLPASLALVKGALFTVSISFVDPTSLASGLFTITRRARILTA
jgi:hypothetical protein